jgi:hypothetical protein
MAHNKDKTHCVEGHPLSGENLYLSRSGRRACRECRAERRAKDRTQGGGNCQKVCGRKTHSRTGICATCRGYGEKIAETP